MRKIININNEWSFIKDVEKNTDGKCEIVNVPHNWNSIDGQDGKNDYLRCVSEYKKTIDLPMLDENEILFVEFQGVNSSSKVCFNDKEIGAHDGGYSTFRLEIDKSLIAKENILKVLVDNRANDTVYPQRADFTFYGGIYRDVNLIITNKNHFDLVKYGALGCDIDVFVKDGKGEIEVKPYIIGEGSVKLTLTDAEGNIVKESSDNKMEVENPHLWNGLKDPYLYTLKVSLSVDGKVVDEFEKSVGFRFFSVDSKKGFFLNGQQYLLRGVSRHQDRKNIGNSF